MTIRYGLVLARTMSVCALIGVAGASTASAQVRTINGFGNNLGNPNAGTANERLIRLGPADYPGDGSGTTMMGATQRANPRDISNRISIQSGSILNNRHLTDFVWQWGQFIDHDISLTQTNPTNGIQNISMNDPTDPMGPNPMPFNRSNFDLLPNTSTLPRQQTNEITSFIDASNIYGSDTTRAMALRTRSGGKLKTSAGNLLPFNTDGLPNAGGPGSDLFVSGDIRVNEQVGLTAMHTLFTREHNRLADLIAAQNPSANDEKIYHQARKIVGAQMQIITYKEFLPSLLGTSAPKAQDFNYSDSLSPSIANSFAHSLYRFGHSMVGPDIQLVDNNGTSAASVSVRDAFFNPGLLTNDPGTLDLLLKGLASQTAQEIDTKVVDDLRNFLFGQPGAGGMDLAALNIQRGRDHGLPDYNTLRQAYGLQKITSFDQITSDTATQQALSDLYDDDLDNIDSWVGALAEDHILGTSVGQLIQAGLLDQFQRLRDADRFFYLNDTDLYDANGNLDGLIKSIIDLDQITLADIIQLNTDITHIQGNVFLIPEPATGFLIAAMAGLMLFSRKRSTLHQHNG